jgi:8-oxo-dGTP pyrophosphatase MutT (NUDIX family)
MRRNLVAPTPLSSAAGIVIRDDCVALIRREHSDRGQLYYLHPGGGVEKGESLEQAVQREVVLR